MPASPSVGRGCSCFSRGWELEAAPAADCCVRLRWSAVLQCCRYCLFGCAITIIYKHRGYQGQTHTGRGAGEGTGIKAFGKARPTVERP